MHGDLRAVPVPANTLSSQTVDKQSQVLDQSRQSYCVWSSVCHIVTHWTKHNMTAYFAKHKTLLAS